MHIHRQLFAGMIDAVNGVWQGLGNASDESNADFQESVMQLGLHMHKHTKSLVVVVGFLPINRKVYLRRSVLVDDMIQVLAVVNPRVRVLSKRCSRTTGSRPRRHVGASTSQLATRQALQ